MEPADGPPHGDGLNAFRGARNTTRQSSAPLVTRRAFEELAEVIRTRGGDAPAIPGEEAIGEEKLVALLDSLDEDTVRALGEHRADSSLKAEEFSGDPLRMNALPPKEPTLF